jgi:plasmid stability protein
MAKKKTTRVTPLTANNLTVASRPGRGADQFMVRLPDGMRATLAELAARHGRSMNAEIVDALSQYTSAKVEDDRAVMLTEYGLIQISKQLAAGVNYLEELLFEVRDVDLETYISDQRAEGVNLTRREAIRKILRAYLDERGYVRRPNSPPA